MIINMFLSANRSSLLLIWAMFSFCILLCSCPLIGQAIYRNLLLVLVDNWSELYIACTQHCYFPSEKYIYVEVKAIAENTKWEIERTAWEMDAFDSTLQSKASEEGKSFVRIPSAFLGRSLWANQLALFCSLIVVFTNRHTEIRFDQSQAIHPDQSMMASSATSGAHTFYHHMCWIIALS